MKKKTIIFSLVALVLCLFLLVGTTFAWFTDTVTSGKNKIQAGKLDLGLEYKNSTQTTYADVTTDTNVFIDSALWEPGHVEYAVLKLSNKGTLAFKYNVGINIASETGSTNVNGDSFNLSSYIKYAVVDGDQSTLTRDALVALAGTGTSLDSAYAVSGSMTAGETAKEVTLIVWLPTSVGNEANYKEGAEVPTINLGINVYATQQPSESDSFGSDYDANTIWLGTADNDALVDNTDAENKEVSISTPEQLAAFANAVNGGNTYEGYTITLENSIDLNNYEWTPIGTSTNAFRGTFDGNGNTISNLKVNTPNNAYAGLFGYVAYGEIKDLTINNANVTGKSQVGAVAGGWVCDLNDIEVTGLVKVTGLYQVGGIVGYVYGDITDSSVTGSVGSFVTGNYKEANLEGDAVGGIVGYRAEGTSTITNCSVSGLTITGTRKVGGIGGQIATGTVDGCTVDVVINSNASAEYIADNKISLGGIMGEKTGDTADTISNCVVKGTINAIQEDYVGPFVGRIRGGSVDTTTNNDMEELTVVLP